jgi:2-keto-4-pentenoate hydratase
VRESREPYRVDATLDGLAGDGAAAIAAAFRQARLRNAALPGFPGPVPMSLEEAYRIQNAAIAAWPDRVAGWKVGRIVGPAQVQFSTDRLIGPVFAGNVWPAGSTEVFTAIAGGFCAVEAEYVFRLAQPSPTDPDRIDAACALGLVDTLLTGIEIAGSPLATINDLGPTVVVSDFGNNAGLFLGSPVANWQDRLDHLEAEVRIDGTQVGRGAVRAFPSGITASLVFALKLAAARGMAMPAGALVSTGAVTGVHPARPGQSGEADFGPDGVLHCTCVAARPEVMA